MLNLHLLVVLSSMTFVARCIIWKSMEYFKSDVAGSTSFDCHTLSHLYVGTIVINQNTGANTYMQRLEAVYNHWHSHTLCFT